MAKSAARSSNQRDEFIVLPLEGGESDNIHTPITSRATPVITDNRTKQQIEFPGSSIVQLHIFSLVRKRGVYIRDQPETSGERPVVTLAATK